MGSMLEFGPAVGRPQLRVDLSGDTLLIEIRAALPDIDEGQVMVTPLNRE